MNSTAATRHRQSMAAEWIFSRMLNRSRSPVGRVATRLAWMLRRLAIRGLPDHVVRYRLGGREVLLPFAHDLPVILATHPLYATNLVRLVEVVAAARARPLVVDIGANVGDTAILIRESVTCPVICVEGDPGYLDLLRRNVDGMADVYPAEAFVSFGADSGSALTLERRDGSAHLRPTGGGSGVTTTPLQAVLDHVGQGGTPRILKVDTDGYDARILIDNQDLLNQARPILFFEYDPKLMRKTGDNDRLRLFRALAGIGYVRALVYQNTGELLSVADVNDEEFWSDLSTCLLVGPPGHYVDLAVFHSDDQALAEAFTGSERRFFALHAAQHVEPT